MPQENVRGIFGFILDLLNWLRIYRQRDFWMQIVAALLGVLLWILILPPESVAGATAAFPSVAFLSFIMTNIVWAAVRKPYSCIIGSSVGYGLYNLAVGAIVYPLSLVELVTYVALGLVCGFVFSWFAFFILNMIGLIKMERRKQEQGSRVSDNAQKPKTNKKGDE